MEAYSMDLRRRVLTACDAGKPTKEVAQTFEVSPAWVRRLKQRRREQNIIAPLPHGGGNRPVLDEKRRAGLAELIRAKPDATLAELKGDLRIKISTGALWNTLRRMGLSLKKSPSTPASRNVRTSRRGGNAGTGS